MMSAAGPPPAQDLQVLVNRAGDRPSLVGEIRSIVRYRDVLFSLVHRDLTVRYRRSTLGFLWTLLNPLFQMLILTLVFSKLFRFDIEHYAVYYLSGVLAWNFFSQSTVTAMSSMSWNGPLMKRVRVPRSLFAISTVLSGVVNLGLSCLPLVAIMLIVGAPIRLSILFLPVSLAVLTLFCCGAALGLSAIAVYFDDINSMYQIALTGLMFFTPIFYPISIVPPKILALMKLNPMYHMVGLFRSPVWGGFVPTIVTSGTALGVALISFGVGWLIFRRLSPGFAIRL